MGGLQAIVNTIASWVGSVVNWLKCLLSESLWCNLYNLFFDIFKGAVTMVVGAITWVPVPGELSGFTWPDPGPLGGILLETGVAQAVAILAAAFTTKFLLRLIPLVRL
jgi:hypothetical protein